MSDDPDDDDFELELEPVDPAILEHQRQRAQEKSDAAFARVEFEEVYRERESDPLLDMEQLRQFRFTIKHLLGATAILAVVMTLFRLTDHFCSAVSILFTVLLAGGWAYVIYRERALRAEKERMRAEFEAGRRPIAESPQPPVETFAPPESHFRFAFSTKQLLVTMTVAAVMMGILSLAGSKGTVAMILGLVAILGLVINALGFEPPAIVILGWWLLLVCYLLLGMWLAVFGEGNQASKLTPPRQSPTIFVADFLETPAEPLPPAKGDRA